MNKSSYNKTLLLASALVLISSLNLPKLLAQNNQSATTPKLIIGIAVDQLRTDYVYALQNKLGEDGLKRLFTEGLVYEQVTFDLDNPDASAALAVLATGAYPFNNGIPSGTVYNAQMARRQSVFYDKQCVGNFTAGNYSPKALISTTLADELKIASSNASKVYTIAPEAEAAIISAGHTADCALWIDDKTGKWASTSYYKDFPHYIVRQNNENALFVDISQANWKPTKKSDGHLDIMPYHYATSSFDHSFYQYGQPCYSWFKTSPLVNDAIVNLTKLCLKSGFVGQGKHTDMLQLTFYAGTFLHERPELYAEELQDIYLRLDKSIAELLSAVDVSVGLNNTLIYLTGTGETTSNTTDVEGTLLGEFNASRCSALLNSYLISLYGQGNWVDGFDNYQFFLNHKTIEGKKLKVSEVQKAAAEFLGLFSGVGDVVTSQQILHEDFSQRVIRMRNGYYKQSGGDLIVELQPGWALKLDDNAETQPQIRHDVAPGPAIIFAPGTVKAERIATPVEATTIAPTIARYIKIRAPSGCTKAPLQLNH